ncbi:MAG: hypothetical protein KH354_09465 [Clostridiales bacterium]|nr:hypothetical protein [Clostridiales bacterium]
MLGKIWAAIVVFSLLFSFFNGTTEQTVIAMTEGAGQGVQLCLTLCGIYALWSGLMAVAEKAGILQALSKLLSPLIRRVFPSAAKSSEAQAAVTLNIAANMLGLGNAATPAGQRAMKELQKVSDDPNRASNDMVMLLVINNSSLTLVPTTVIALRAAAGSASPGAIIPAALAASLVSTLAAYAAARFLQGKGEARLRREQRKRWSGS